MANKIIFDASIDVAPFKENITEMKNYSDVFFDAAEARVEGLSEKFRSIGEDFEMPDMFNSEGLELFSSTLKEMTAEFTELKTLMEDAATSFDEVEESVSGISSAFKILDGASLAMQRGLSILSVDTEKVNTNFGNAKTFVKGFAEALKTGEIKMKLLNAAKAVFNALANANPIGLIITAIALLTAGIVTLIKNWDDVKEAFLNFINGVMDFLSPFIDWMSNNIIGPIADGWKKLWGGISEGASNLWSKMKDTFGPVAGWMKTNVTAIMDGDWGALGENIRGGFENVKNFMQDTFGPTADWMRANVTAVMDGDWETLRDNLKIGFEAVGNFIKGIFERLPEPIKNVINGLIGFVNGMIQRIVGGLNSVIRTFNRIGFDLPDWMGGGSFRINIPEAHAAQIPFLARGGIVDRPTLAMIGERGKEAVMPLENNTGWITDLANSIGAVVGAQLAFNNNGAANGGASAADKPVQLYLDGIKFAEAIIDDFAEVAGYRDLRILNGMV